LRDVESIRGSGVRVISLDHDAAVGTTSLIVDIAPEGTRRELLSRSVALEARGQWRIESIVSRGRAMRLHLRRTDTAADPHPLRD
jgi:hypothetical protein